MPASPDEVAALGAQARRWARTHLDAAELEARGEIPRSVFEVLAELGLFALTIPEAHGGGSLGLVGACPLVEELARHDRSVATTVGLHAGLGTQAIVRGASPDVASAWLPRLATGASIGAFAATEAGAGSDLMSIRTALVDDGAELRLDGEKSYVTNAHYAGCITVLARRGERAHSLVLVPCSTPGVSIGAEEEKLGLRASSTATIRFDGVRVPRDHVLGVDGAGLDLAYAVLGWGRTLMSAGCVGTMAAALDATIAHVTTRRQFRRPLAAFPAVQSAVAEMAVMLDASRALVRRTSSALDAGRVAEAASFATKVFASERAFRACDAAIQLHGALGVIEPVGVARLLRDCRVTRIFEGANDVLLVRLASLGLASGEPLERVSADATPLVDAAGACDRMADAIDAATVDVRRRLGLTAISHQTTLGALARAEMAHHAAVAIVLDPPRDRERLALALRLLERDAAAALATLGPADAIAAQERRVCARLCRTEDAPMLAEESS